MCKQVCKKKHILYPKGKKKKKSGFLCERGKGHIQINISVNYPAFALLGLKLFSSPFTVLDFTDQIQLNPMAKREEGTAVIMITNLTICSANTYEYLLCAYHVQCWITPVNMTGLPALMEPLAS